MVKIALVILHADPARGGAERYTVDLAAALARRGSQVSLLASSFAAPIDGVTNVLIKAGGVTRTQRYRRFLDSLEDYLAANTQDIVHAMLPVRQCDIYHPHAGLAAAQARRTGKRMLFAPRRRTMARVERDLLTGTRPPIVLSLSNYVKKEIVIHYPTLPADRLATLFNAVDLERFRPRQATGVIRDQLPRGAVVGLFIGKDYVRKGLAEAVSALGKLQMPGSQSGSPALAIVGHEDVRKLGLSLPPGVTVLAFPSTTDPLAYYADADFFVLPTRHDPCSLVVLEALAMGLPVISTRFNGATEIMTDGVHGFILNDPGDLDALASAMREMMDPDRRAAMRAACISLRPQLSYEQHLDKLESIYTAARPTSIAINS